MTDDAIHVIEGVVIGHARCQYAEGCTEMPMRVVDPYANELSTASRWRSTSARRT